MSFISAEKDKKKNLDRGRRRRKRDETRKIQIDSLAFFSPGC